jgi:HTH-like domain
VVPQASLRRICRVLQVPRSTLYGDQLPQEAEAVAGVSVETTPSRAVSDPVVDTLRTLVTTYPTFGYRRLTVLLRTQLGQPINRKRVARLMRQHRWQVTNRVRTGPPTRAGVGQPSNGQQPTLGLGRHACGLRA